jgi:RNA recognition motif-containing protein
VRPGAENAELEQGGKFVSKVYVGNLSYGTTAEEIRALFAPMGELSDVFLPLDRDSGRPRGFAFVTFESPEGAAEAIRKLDGAELGGRNLRVNEASAERPGGSAPRGGRPGGPAGPPSRPKGSRRNIRGRKRGFA